MLWYFFLWLSAAACFVDKMIHVLAYILTFEIQHNRTAGSYNVSSSPFFDKIKWRVFFVGGGGGLNLAIHVFDVKINKVMNSTGVT